MKANKPILLFLYGVALYFVLKQYYKNGHAGLPEPQIIRNPTYLYGLLAIVSDFTAGLTVPIAAGLTVALIWQTNNQTSKQKTTTKKTTPNPGSASTKPSQAGGNGVVHLPSAAVKAHSI